MIGVNIKMDSKSIILKDVTTQNKWEIILELKDTGYYICWRRIHGEIHMPEPMMPMSKDSIVQIGGKEGMYEIRGMTTAHCIFPNEKYSVGKPGLSLFDKKVFKPTLAEAQAVASEFKKEIAKRFDKVTRTDSSGKLIERERVTENG